MPQQAGREIDCGNGPAVGRDGGSGEDRGCVAGVPHAVATHPRTAFRRVHRLGVGLLARRRRDGRGDRRLGAGVVVGRAGQTDRARHRDGLRGRRRRLVPASSLGELALVLPRRRGLRLHHAGALRPCRSGAGRRRRDCIGRDQARAHAVQPGRQRCDGRRRDGDDRLRGGVRGADDRSRGGVRCTDAGAASAHDRGDRGGGAALRAPVGGAGTPVRRAAPPPRVRPARSRGRARLAVGRRRLRCGPRRLAGGWARVARHRRFRRRQRARGVVDGGAALLAAVPAQRRSARTGHVRGPAPAP